MSKNLEVYFNNHLGRGMIQREAGHIYLHLNLYKLDKKIIEWLRAELDVLLDRFADEGHAVIFAVASTYQSVRFWNMIKPCFEVHQLEDGSWLGSWLTFEDE